MTTVFHEVQQTSTAIESLRHKFENSAAPVTSVVITHDDEQMIECLESAKGGNGVAFCAIAQSEWSRELGGILAWSVEAGVKQIIIAGHSHGHLKNGVDDLDDLDAANIDSTTRLFLGAKNNVTEVLKARRHFSEQISSLINSEEVLQIECDDDFQLSTLFFVAENGSFMTYNIAEDNFEVLI